MKLALALSISLGCVAACDSAPQKPLDAGAEVDADTEFDAAVFQEPYPKALVHREPRVRSLREGEGLEVEYHSQGCFHNDWYRFVFEGGDPVVVHVFGANDSAEGRRIGSIELTPQEVRATETTIAFLRSEPGDFCTTVDRYTLTWTTSAGETTEAFDDGSCGSYALDEPMLNFRELASRLN